MPKRSSIRKQAVWANTAICLTSVLSASGLYTFGIHFGPETSAPLLVRFAAGVLAIVLGVVAGLAISRMLQSHTIRPIEEPAARIPDQLRKNCSLSRHSTSTPDELSVLESGFDQLLSHAESLEKRLREAHQQFDDQLREHTRELSIFKRLVEDSGQGFGMATVDGEVIYCNASLKRMTSQSEQGDWDQLDLFDYYTTASKQMLEQRVLPSVIRTGQWSGELNLQGRSDDEPIPTDQNLYLMCDEAERPICLAYIITDVTEKKRAEATLKALHQQVVDAARRAGMAEVATGVLHNVGNVLNSVNVSIEVMRETLDHSEVGDLNRALSLVRDRRDDLADFATNDPRGRALPTYLAEAGQALSNEHNHLLETVGLLATHVNHIKNIVRMQQSYTHVAGIAQPVSLAKLLDDAIELNAAGFTRHDITIQRDYETMPDVVQDGHKLMQVVVNLIKNGKESIVASGVEAGLLTLRLRSRDKDNARIEVIDNGVGIEHNHLQKVFSYGFTTKLHGHGFGLHSCANLIGELGGNIVATSDGPGKGATFAVSLPKIYREGNAETGSTRPPQTLTTEPCNREVQCQ